MERKTNGTKTSRIIRGIWALLLDRSKAFLLLKEANPILRINRLTQFPIRIVNKGNFPFSGEI